MKSKLKILTVYLSIVAASADSLTTDCRRGNSSDQLSQSQDQHGNVKVPYLL